MMMEYKSTSKVFTLLLTCAAVMLTSCSDSLVYKTPAKSKSQGYGPPAHAPAWGYRRKQGQTVVVSSGPAVAGTIEKSSKKDDDDNHKTDLLIAGAAVAAGTVYGVVNERDKKQTQAEMDELKQEINVVTVNVVNSNGSISQVRLQKQGVGYVGPKGEYYDHLPTPEELKPAYGL